MATKLETLKERKGKNAFENKQAKFDKSSQKLCYLKVQADDEYLKQNIKQ